MKRRREPLPDRPGNALHEAAGVELAEASPEPGVRLQRVVRVEGTAVVRKRGDQQAGRRQAATVVPRQNVLPAQGVEEPCGRFPILAVDHREENRRVSRPHRPIPSIQVSLAPDLRLKPDVDLADVVEGGEDRQTGRRRVV